MAGIHWTAVVLAALMAGVGPHALGDDVRYVASHRVLLTFTPGNGSPVKDVELWITDDQSRTWHSEPASLVGDSTLCYTAPVDGIYGFYLILKNAAGSSSEPPSTGSKPHVRVIVDTIPPTLQVHGPATATMPAARAGQLALRVTLIDENLGDGGGRVFYRVANETKWTDGGVATVSDGQLLWQVPAGVAGPLDLRVASTDLAGNQATDELLGVAVEPARIEAEHPSPGSAAGEPPTTQPGPSAVVLPAAVEPVRVEPVPAVTLAAKPATNPPAPRQRQESLTHLKRLGRRFMNEQRYGLATARLEDALELEPSDADLLVDLGSALYWSKRYDEAGGRFEAALKAFPNHTGAIDGLALVAATQKRYPQAREHLLHLLELQPQSASAWLHYGDIEHKLGNRQRAMEAWERATKLENADEAVCEKAQKRLKAFAPAPRRTQP